MQSFDQVGATRREYSLTTSRRVGQSVLAAVFLAGAGFFLRLAVNPIGRDFVLVVGGTSLILGLALIAQVWTSRLVLDGDRIAVRSIFRAHSTTLAEIEGVRKTENQHGRWTRIYLKQGLGSFSSSSFFVGNADLQMVESCLSRRSRCRRDCQASRPSKAVSTTGARCANALGRAKAWAIGLSVLAGVASIPVMFISYVPVYRASLVLLLICPTAGIVLLRLYPLLFTAFRRKPDPRADIGFLLAWPGVGLMFSYQTPNDPTRLLDMFQLLYWALVILVILLASVLPSVWRSPSRWAVLFTLIITGGMYHIGVVNSANTLLDRSPARPFGTLVLKKSESHTSKGTRYFLRVAPSGPIPYSEDVDVPMLTYNATRLGDPVCYGLHSGFLTDPGTARLAVQSSRLRSLPNALGLYSLKRPVQANTSSLLENADRPFLRALPTRAAGSAPWSEIAYALNHHDQMHMIRDFMALEATPTVAF